MTAYDITLSGCDDSTQLLDIELTDDELKVVQRVAFYSQEAGGGCAPTMLVKPSPLSPPDGASCANCYQPIRPYTWSRDKYGDWIHLGACPRDSA